MAGLIGRLRRFFNVDRAGSQIGEGVFDAGNEPTLRGDNFQASGDDSQPLQGDYVLAMRVQGTGRYALVGWSAPNITPKSGPGERRFYARDPATGEIKAEVFLRSDGTIELTNAFGSTRVSSAGDIVSQNDAGSFTVSASGQIKAENQASSLTMEPGGSATLQNAAGSIGLSSSGTASINGASVDPAGNITTIGALAASAVTATATGISLGNHVHGDGPTPSTPVVNENDPELLILDLAPASPQLTAPGYVGAAWIAGEFPGISLFRKVGIGPLQSVAQFDGPANVAVADGFLPAGRDHFVVDRVNTLSISVISGAFETVSESDFFQGANLCAYGKPGRWEIIQFRVADGVLSEFLGGLFGTEQEADQHEPGDYIVILSDIGARVVGIDISGITETITHRAVKSIQDPATAIPEAFDYQGRNLEPLSGVNARAEQSGNDWVISWTPRTRFDTSTVWVTGAPSEDDLPIQYEVDILDGAAVVRTISTGAPEATYTEAQQIEDFGSPVGAISASIYQINSLIGRGRALALEA